MMNPLSMKLLKILPVNLLSHLSYSLLFNNDNEYFRILIRKSISSDIAYFLDGSDANI